MFDLKLLKSPFFIIKNLQQNLIRQYGPRLTGKVLDIGCGKRPYRRFLGACEYMGMDSNPEVGPDVVGGVPGLPFEDDSFDGVLCTEVLEHVSDTAAALVDIGRVLKSRGILYLTVPMSWCLHYEPNDFYRFTKYGLEHLLRASGFEVEVVKRVGGFASLCAQRKIDVFYFLLLRLKIPSSLALVLLAPFSILWYLLSLVFDRIDRRDALGWAMLAKKL